MNDFRKCHFYRSENEDGEYVHDESDKNGFCLLQDLFTLCVFKCGNFTPYTPDDTKETNIKGV